MIEDIVVNSVADAASNNADREGNCGHGGDEIVYCSKLLLKSKSQNFLTWANDRRDDAGRDENTTDTETRNNKNSVDSMNVVLIPKGHESRAECHEAGRCDHQQPNMASQNGEQHKHNAGTSQDCKPDRQSSHTNSDRIMAVDVKTFCRPKHEYREEIGAGNGCDEQSKREHSRYLLQTVWKHGIWCEPALPDEERDDEKGS